MWNLGVSVTTEMPRGDDHQALPLKGPLICKSSKRKWHDLIDLNIPLQIYLHVWRTEIYMPKA